MNVSGASGETLRTALAGVLGGLPPSQAAKSVERLIAHYRGTTPTDAPVLRDRSDVVAYAAYRMPATFEAARSALDALRAAAPEWVPETHTDIGGGTGAASWAVADVWDGRPPRTTVLDWAEPALALGRELADGVLDAEWRRERIGTALRLAETDLVTVSYVLKELTEADRAALVAEAARASTGAVVIVEPGTPDGYERIIAARSVLIDAGFTVAAPCPHSGACPIEPGTDWCHFAARVSRSSLHRQVKGGSLPYEDEKYAYVAATLPRSRLRSTGGTPTPVTPAPARVIRRPQTRKGLVLLDLCAPGGLERATVTKRHGPLYKQARDAEWGDSWPPAEEA
ncbi:small ribosomal subunit Rsm22 family protein [Streptomyces sp. NPDC047974]|uniref:small ribosomal subunit Rsm22 family protein n=1 Tax=Streptomyces sp. NPDC047974 TaxID=3154343 RepID=UPI0033EB1081